MDVNFQTLTCLPLCFVFSPPNWIGIYLFLCIRERAGSMACRSILKSKCLRRKWTRSEHLDNFIKHDKIAFANYKSEFTIISADKTCQHSIHPSMHLSIQPFIHSFAHQMINWLILIWWCYHIFSWNLPL